MRRVIEFLCLLPLAIPAIVIVVGIAPIYRWMGQHLGAVGASPLTLAFIDIILVLPFAYRAIDAEPAAIDFATLADAARSLGAGWPRTIFQVIVPNIRGGILSARCSRSRWSSASTRSRRCCPSTPCRSSSTCSASATRSSSVAVSFAALFFAFVLLFVITRFAPGPGRGRSAPRRAHHMTAATSPGPAATDTASASRSRTCIAGTARSTPSTG